MPAAHDVYAEQLSELRRGEPLYYPEPHPQDGPIEIGDLGFMKEGAFYRLLNVAKSRNDPDQLFGVPDDFERLNMGVIRKFEAALEPGPLHSRTVSTIEADIGTQGGMLPAEASFRFKCASKRGAILMLESEMIREEAIQSSRFENYLRRHCASFFNFAKSHDIHLGFGDLMLVTGTSKTAAWSSVVYSNSCKEFGLVFSVGNPFLPSGAGVSASSGVERTGPVERRRSRQRALPENAPLPNNHTVFVKACRLGTREAYYQSMVSLFVKTLDPKFRERLVNGRTKIAQLGVEGGTSPSTAPASALSLTDFHAMIIRPEGPDFHPAIPFLGIAMETSDSECVVIHDDDWCSSASPEASLLIEKYADFHFDNGSGSLLSAMASISTDLEVGAPPTQLDAELFSMLSNLKHSTLRDSDDIAPTLQPSIIEHALREAFTKFTSNSPLRSDDLDKDQDTSSDCTFAKGQSPHPGHQSAISYDRVTTMAISSMASYNSLPPDADHDTSGMSPPSFNTKSTPRSLNKNIIGDDLSYFTTDISPVKASSSWLSANIDDIRSTLNGIPDLSNDDIVGLEKLIYPRFFAYTAAHLKLYATAKELAEFKTSMAKWISLDEITLLQNYRSVKATLWALQRRFRNEGRAGVPHVKARLSELMQLDVHSIATQVLAIINDDRRRVSFLGQRGPKAQILLDLLQEVMDVLELDILRPPILAVILQLSMHSGLYPASLFLQGIVPQGKECVAGGSYADIWAGKLSEDAVAIKVMRVDSSSVGNGIKGCFQEAIVLRQLHHPNVLPFYGVWQWPELSGASSRLCLITPWMENGNIVHFLQENPDADRRSLTLDIAHGLQYLHTFEPPIIHGNLRGYNVLITLDKRACITAFGAGTLASRLSQGGDRYPQFTLSSPVVMSTNGFLLAPEFFEYEENGEETPQQSFATDIYSFACVCYEIFAGHERFSELHSFPSVAFAVARNRRPIRPAHEALDDAIWKLMDNCWAKEPTARPTASGIVQYLLSHLAPGYAHKVYLKPTQPLLPLVLRTQNSLVDQDIIIALVGATGAGKSHFINIATQRSSVVVGDDLESCTQDIQVVRYPHPDGSGRDIVFVDTPGFDDTERTDYKVLKQIAHWMKETYSEHITLSGILFFHRITDVRMRGIPLRNISMFEALCGKDALLNVVLTTTMWDEVSPELGFASETELKENFWAPMMGQGCRTARFQNTFASAWQIIDLFCAILPRALLIQREMVDEKKKLEATTACSILVRWWEQVSSEFKGKFGRRRGKPAFDMDSPNHS